MKAFQVLFRTMTNKLKRLLQIQVVPAAEPPEQAVFGVPPQESSWCLWSRLEIGGSFKGNAFTRFQLAGGHLKNVEEPGSMYWMSGNVLGVVAAKTLICRCPLRSFFRATSPRFRPKVAASRFGCLLPTKRPISHQR